MINREVDALKIKVLLFEDHPLLVEGIISTLEDSDSIEVIGTENSVDNALEKYIEYKPDVVILDVRFEGEKSGLDALKEIIAYNSEAIAVMLSQYDQEYFILQAYQMGAKAFIKKGDTPDELVTAILTVSNNETYFSPSIAQKIARALTKNNSMQALDEKDIYIFRMVAEGYTHQEIATEMSLSSKAVGNRIHNIKTKLGIDRAAEFTKMAIRHGIISD